MSVFSDYKVGALSDDEYRSACTHMSREDREDAEGLLEYVKEYCDVEAEYMIGELLEFAERNHIEADYIAEQFIKAFQDRVKEEA